MALVPPISTFHTIVVQALLIILLLLSSFHFVFHFDVASAVPYLGPFLVLVGTGMAAFIQFGELEMSIIVAGTSLAITSIQGYLLTPWLTSHISSLNAVAIFIGLLFWGWLWGPVGLVVATPILMIVKSLCDHVVNLRPVGELLGK